MDTKMSEEIMALFNLMKLEMEKQTITITDAITNKIMQSLDEKIEPLVKENKILKFEVETLNSKVKYLENFHRRKNIIIHGIKEVEKGHEDLLEKVTELFNKNEVKIEKFDIDKVHRIGKQNAGKTRPILLSLTSYNKKIEILKNKKTMPENTYITEDFSKETLQKRQELKDQLKEERRKGNEAYIYNNKVIVKNRENEKRKRDTSVSPQGSSKPTPAKVHRTDPFAYMRSRSTSLTEKTNKA